MAFRSLSFFNFSCPVLAMQGALSDTGVDYICDAICTFHRQSG
jgi:hypothetical protein